MKTVTIIKRSWYLVLALMPLAVYVSIVTFRAIRTTLVDGQKVVWAFQASVDPKEVTNGVVVNHYDGDTQFVPVEDKKPTRINKYWLRYNYSSRGV